MTLLDSLPSPSPLILSLFAVLLVSIGLRLLAILPSRHATSTPTRRDGETVTVGAFLGSGGHTTELLQLLSALPSSRYVHRTYLVSSGDRLSSHKAQSAEASRSSQDLGAGSREDYAIIELPRAREVHQSFLSTPISVLGSFFACLSVLLSKPPWEASRSAGQNRGAAKGARPWVDVLLMNGPGTCVPLVAAVYVLKFINKPTPKLIYVESFARVRSLSLTARLLRYVVDRFVVQWDAADEEGQEEVSSKAGHKQGEQGGREARTRSTKRQGAENRGWLI